MSFFLNLKYLEHNVMPLFESLKASRISIRCNSFLYCALEEESSPYAFIEGR